VKKDPPEAEKLQVMVEELEEGSGYIPVVLGKCAQTDERKGDGSIPLMRH
jgi:hypothetical protein